MARNGPVATHTYIDNRDADLLILCIYPSNDDLNSAAKITHEEAENLWTLLRVPPSAPNVANRLPSIRA